MHESLKQFLFVIYLSLSPAISMVPTTLQNSFSLTLSDFSGQNESFSLTNLFTRNTNVGFQSLAIALETKAAEQIQKHRYK